VARAYPSATLLADGTVLITGGFGCYTNDCPNFAHSEFYSPAIGKFIASASMTAKRSFQTATLLNDGRVLIPGGLDSENLSKELATAELYTPNSSTPPPLLFSVAGDGNGQGAILHANTPRIASPDDRAVAGDALEIYLTGLTA